MKNHGLKYRDYRMQYIELNTILLYDNDNSNY